MDYLALIKGLLGEVSSSKRIAKLGTPVKILAFIGLLPFIIGSAFAILGYVCLTFFYKIVSASVDYLEKWVDRKKADVRQATEAVLYFVTMPWIFFCNVLLSFASVLYCLSWFFIQCFTYLASLGGIKWQPFIMDAKFDEPKKPANVYSHMTKCIAAVSYFIAFVFFALFFLIYLADGDEDFFSIAAVIDVIYTLGVAISVPIIFKSGESDVDYDDEYVAASGYAFSSGDLPEL